MAELYYPFDDGNGDNATETQWRRMGRLWSPPGVVSGLAVSVGPVNTINVSAGSAWVDGHMYENTTSLAVTFTPNSLATSRTMYVVIELNPTTNIIAAKCVDTSPTQSPTGNYQLLVATFVLPPSTQTQTATQIIDKRVMIGDWKTVTYNSPWGTFAGSQSYPGLRWRMTSAGLVTDGMIVASSSTTNPIGNVGDHIGALQVADSWVPVHGQNGVTGLRIRTNGQIELTAGSGTGWISCSALFPRIHV
ncbi:hypothetical protein [Cumulibacter soli]|uniref:hypothetical protein n=1 Tax=Cumulibacter soli TaxID=2546344 RepID=UPI0010681A9F|nr:hypothetical protein [Cumulibacter soli]